MSCRRYQKNQMTDQDNDDWESSSSEQAEYVARNVSEKKRKVNLANEGATANDQDETTAKCATTDSANASRQNATTEKAANIITADAVFAGNKRIDDSVVGKRLGLDSNDLCAIDAETAVDASRAPLESTEIDDDVPIHSSINSETMLEMLQEDLLELIGPAALEKKCAQIVKIVLGEMGLDWNDPCTDYAKYVLDKTTYYAIIEKIRNKIAAESAATENNVEKTAEGATENNVEKIVACASTAKNTVEEIVECASTAKNLAAKLVEYAIRGTTGEERKRLKDNVLRNLKLALKNPFPEYDDRMTVDATTAKNDGESKEEVPEEKTATRRVDDKPEACSEGMDCGEDGDYERPGIAEEMMQG